MQPKVENTEPARAKACVGINGSVWPESNTNTGDPGREKDRVGIPEPTWQCSKVSTEASRCARLWSKGASPNWRGSDADTSKP